MPRRKRKTQTELGAGGRIRALREQLAQEWASGGTVIEDFPSLRGGGRRPRPVKETKEQGVSAGG